MITFGSRQSVATAGSVILINAEDVHANRSAESESVAMKVRTDVLGSIAGDIGGRGTDVSFPDAVVDDPPLFAGDREAGAGVGSATGYFSDNRRCFSSPLTKWW